MVKAACKVRRPSFIYFFDPARREKQTEFEPTNQTVKRKLPLPDHSSWHPLGVCRLFMPVKQGQALPQAQVLKSGWFFIFH